MKVRKEVSRTIAASALALTVTLLLVQATYIGDVTEVWVQPPFIDAKYVCGKYNSTCYYAQNGTTGYYDYLGTSAVAACEYALNHLTSGRTWKEKVVFQDELTFTSSLDVPSWVCIENQGLITVSSGANYPAIRNSGASTDPSTPDNGEEAVEIYGGMIKGNAGSDTSTSHGIFWRCNGANPYDNPTDGTGGTEIWFHDMEITCMGGDCIHVNMTGSDIRHVWITRIRGRWGYNNRYGLYAQSLFDSRVEECLFVSQGGDMELLYPVSNHFDSIYTGLGGIDVNGGTGCVFTNLRQDNCATDAVEVYGAARYHVFSSLIITDTGWSANNTYRGIDVYGTAHHNSFSNIVFNSDGEKGGGKSHNFTQYNIYEAATCSYNSFGGSIVFMDYITGPYSISGSGSSIANVTATYDPL